MIRPRVRLTIAAVGVVAIAGAGWAVGRGLRSPAEEALSRQPPKPSLITANVTRQKLTSQVTTNGVLAYGSPQPVSLAGAVGTSGGTAGGAGEIQRVTRAPRKGRITEGKVLMEVNGRPVFALRGKVPMHRTLAPGTSGADVKQLQKALRAPVTGVFDQGTAAAVRAWYAKKGYQPQEPSLADGQTRDQLTKAVQDARQALATDLQALETAGDLRLLRTKLADAKSGQTQAQQAVAETAALEALPEDLQKLSDLRKNVRQAEEELLAARQALNAARQPAATPTPTPAPAPAPAPAPVATQDNSLLELKVSNAQTNLRAARDSLAAAGEQAGKNLDAKLTELRKAVALAHQEVLAAEQTLKQARATSPLKIKIAGDRANLATAKATLAAYLSSYGVTVPAGELLFFAKLPARLDKVYAKTGLVVGEKVGTATASTYAITATVAREEAELLKVGMEVTFEDPVGKKFPATLTRLGAVSDTTSVWITPNSDAGLKGLLGSALTTRISVGSTSGEVLTVPVAALVTSADGSPYVKVETRPDQVRKVEVKTGLTAGGFVQVISSELRAGDKVVVGDG
ncbi:peptidoglycan-binding protein [Nonomuraea sp. NBC_01738]|uniref:peptidoglycan-binding protein n=1 Tax=Nonomuraea sp. NBC_01738 TaxID=2976003 RepID=UPI002E0F368A|nr:peptidoglycan-binding protein [Nonomuraea sp. NBC_01738]